MNLSKEKWRNVPLGNICNVLRGDIITKKTIVSGNIPVIASAIGPSYYHNKANRNANIITITCSGNAGYIDFYDTPIYASDCITVEPIDKSANEVKYIYYALKSVESKIKSLQRGTAQKHIYPKDIIPLEIPLPNQLEQKFIAGLFHSIETSIEHAKAQENILNELKKTVVNGLLKEMPVFGNLLNAKNCTLTSFAAIAECDKKYREHKKEPTRFIGLENIKSENFQIQGWGDVEKGTTFTKRFVIGDVLFGKRRAYLKKVAIADFDGLCSGDILVLRAKEKQVLPKLLPFYISSETFIQHAVSTSAGSLSPRTKWKDLAELQLSIPDLETQKKILDILEGIMSNIVQLNKQQASLENLKQKLFSEILG